MIPILPDQTLDHKDGETVYSFRYLTEAQRMVEYRKICKTETDEREECLRLAKEIVLTEEPEIHAKAIEIMQQRRNENPVGFFAMYDAYINLFLAGWSGPPNFPAFPSDGNPARCFRYLDKVKMYNIIQDNIGELIGLNMAEIKN
jgi:hypothetical protein